MEEAINILPPSHWIAFNRVCKFHKVYFLSQLTLCDGKTIQPTFLMTVAPTQNTMHFPLEYPTPDDFTLWISTLRHLASSSLMLPFTLGHFLRLPYTTTHWTTNPDHSQLVHHSQQNKTVHTASHHTTATWRRRQYVKSNRSEHLPNTTLLASAMPANIGTYYIHSSAKLLHPHSQPTNSLLDILQKHTSAHLLQYMEVDNDGHWIVPAARLGSLIMVHDGSYNMLCSSSITLHDHYANGHSTHM